MIPPIVAMLLVPQDAVAAPAPDDVSPSLAIGTVAEVAAVDMILSRTARNDDGTAKVAGICVGAARAATPAAK